MTMSESQKRYKLEENLCVCRCRLKQTLQHLTLSDPDSEDTEEAEECCWGLEMDMGESALYGDAESLCCSSEAATPPLRTPDSSETASLGDDTEGGRTTQ